MDALFAPPTAHGPILLVVSLALAGVIAALNSAFDRWWDGRRRAVLMLALGAAMASAPLLGLAGLSAVQCVVFPLVITPMLLGAMAAKRALRRALHLPC